MWTKSEADLALADEEFLADDLVDLHLGDRAVDVDRSARMVRTAAGRRVPYDELVLATGSVPFVPPVPGRDLPGVFVYRTLDDLDAMREAAAVGHRPGGGRAAGRRRRRRRAARARGRRRAAAPGPRPRTSSRWRRG